MILVGPAGTGMEMQKGLEHIKGLGLDACEIPFTHGIWMTNEKAELVRELNRKLKLHLSIHAPYYINLCSKEKQKIADSKKRILQSMERGHIIGATDVVFHAGFYQGRDKKTVSGCIREQITSLQDAKKENGWKVNISPETTGKATQFGDLDELFLLRKETGCSICVDFSHILARNNGDADFAEIVKRLKKEKIGHVHSHFSGIEYNGKGEKRHIPLQDGFIKSLLVPLLAEKLDITIICEAPDTVGDAARIKNILGKM